MNKTAIKNYAVAARRKLIEAVRLKARQLYIFEESDKAIPHNEAISRLHSDGIFLSPEHIKALLRLYEELLSDDMPYKIDIYNRVMEEVAYTWFNRLIALRFMEVNDYLPSGIRILSSLDEGRSEPDAMREAERLDYVDQAKITELRADTSNNASEKLYKYILISQCNALSAILPGMFEKINDYTELLLPDVLYTTGGIVHDLVHAIAEDDFRDQVQIIGWLYQYYISEKKDEVFAALKKNIKINKDTIPAATQLFTPEWIVKYMVENSLGRLWLENDRAESGLSDEYMNASYYGWKYYVEEAEQEPEVAEQLRVLRAQNPINRPEEIKLLDPCMGSGHILVYAFDVLYQIYQSQGYAERAIPNLILQNNIYGLDIDDRAGQLAYFALMMKARSYNRRFFKQRTIPNANVHSIPEMTIPYVFDYEIYLGAHMSMDEKENCHENLMYLVKLFKNGKEYGSALKIEREIDYRMLRIYIHDYSLGLITIEEFVIQEQIEILDQVIDVASVLSQKYDVVVTNPPYMGNSGMNANLSEYVNKYYPKSKNDLFAVFIEKCGELCSSKGFVAMITTLSWLTISSYLHLRKNILHNKTICQLIYIGYNTFPELNSKVAQGVTFICQNTHIDDYVAKFFDLHKGLPMSYDKHRAFVELRNKRTHALRNDNFKKIPGMPLSHSLTENDFRCFKDYKNVGNHFDVVLGLKTGDNGKYLRQWHEIDFTKFLNKCFTREEAKRSKKKWFPYSKGGNFRKWYGNFDLCVNWENDGSELKAQNNSGLTGIECYFNPGITWTGLSNEKTGFREHITNGSIFDTNKGPMIFERDTSLYFLLGYLNSKVVERWLFALNSSLSIQTGDVKRVPFFVNSDVEKTVSEIAKKNVEIAKTDWDSFETSWDFKRHPLVFPSFGGVDAERTGWLFPSFGGVAAERTGWSHSRNTTNYRALPYNPKLKKRASELRKAGVLSEVLLWQQLKKGQLNGWDFDRQKIIGNYIVDFYCANINLVIEIDGSSHDNKEEYDEQRDAYINGLGLSIIHIPDIEVKQNLRGVVEMIRNYPGLHPSLTGGGKPPRPLCGYPSKGGELTTPNALRPPLQRRGINHPGRFAATPPKEGNLSDIYNAWKCFSEQQFAKLKANEEELNRIFIEIYGLQDELTPAVEDKDVTIRKADLSRDIRSFLSYAVGCMFGRYSLDEPGLVFAGGEFDMSRFKIFLPEKKNIIPLGNADYFDNDIVVRFVEFVRVVYSDDTLNENLNFIANALYPNSNGSPKEKIRRYFLNDFYKDHVKIYKKRPIYWLLDSGKKNGFKALFYLHRYDKYTVAQARTDYLHPLQRKYEAESQRLETLSVSTDNVREKAACRREIETSQGKIEECRIYDQVVAHIAHQQIELDLDDGVKVNYAKFQGMEVPKDNGKTETMDLLAKI